jgi:hypothetical protein
MVSTTTVIASPSRAFSSSNAPVMIARHACQGLLAKLMSVRVGKASVASQSRLRREFVLRSPADNSEWWSNEGKRYKSHSGCFVPSKNPDVVWLL